MAFATDAASLAEASKCYCFDAVTREKVRIYLLAVAAGKDGETPSALAEAAKCYCFDPVTQKKVEAYLLCAIANAEGA